LLAAGLVNIGVEWVQGYNRQQEELPHFYGIENYKEPSSQPGQKNGKRKTSQFKRDSVPRNEHPKVPLYHLDTVEKKLLMDSLRKGI
jgi:hypothetical protein